MSDDMLFKDMDDADEQAMARDEEDVADAAPIVGGMGVVPGSGATGISGTGMAPPVPAEAARTAADDVTATPDEEELREDGVE